LLRQWLPRSDVWKLAAGAGISSLLFLGLGYGQKFCLEQALRRGNPGQVAEARQRFLAMHGTTFGFDEAFGRTVQAGVPATSSGWPIRTIQVSPRISALKRRIESGDRHALDEFWQEATRTGTPLIEPGRDGAHEVIATFVWRGDANTQNVGLLAPLANSPGLPNVQLSQLLNTNLWYGSWQMKGDLRFTYRFVPNVKPGENPQQFATVDPLNPHRMEVSFEGSRIPPTQLSIASMPSAPEERWIAKQAGVPTGKVEEFALKSALLGSERKIWVYTPPDYADKAPDGYRLLVLFDGFVYQNLIPAPTILDNLIHARKMPAIVAVLIDNPPESRMSELEYNPTFLVGMQHPDLFGNVLSQSGSFWDGNKDVKWEWLASQYEAKPKLALRFFIDAGLLEDVAKDGPTLLAANRRLVTILRSKGYLTTYEEVGGTHEPVHWRSTFGDGLISLMK
jgi:enterochelin esterase-like enzyme